MKMVKVLATLAPPSASTLVLPAQYHWQCTLDQGPALQNHEHTPESRTHSQTQNHRHTKKTNYKHQKN